MAYFEIHNIANARGSANNHDNKCVVVHLQVNDRLFGSDMLNTESIKFYLRDMQAMQSLALALMAASTELVSAMHTIERVNQQGME